MNKDLISVFEYMEREKGIKREAVIEAISEALQTAAKRSVQGGAQVHVSIDSKTGEIEIVAKKEVVAHVQFPDEEIAFEIAKEIYPDCQVGDWVDIAIEAQHFGRIAAGAARQLMNQKLRYAERDVIHEEFRHRINEIVSGTVKRFIRGKSLVIDLGKVEALLPLENYPKTERYNIGERVQALLLEVRDTENGGAEVILTRSHPQFVEELFRKEVPELSEGVITIEKIVRDPGYRTKIAVSSVSPKVDPVGSCVGVRGTRVKNVIRELNNEKIDIFSFSTDPIELLQNSLDPLEIKKIGVDDEQRVITFVVEDEDYAKVIGKRGSNLRLNEQLLDYSLVVKKLTEYNIEYNLAMEEERIQAEENDRDSLDQELDFEGINPLIKDSLIQSQLTTLRKLLSATKQQLSQQLGISEDAVEKLLDELKRKRK